MQRSTPTHLTAGTTVHFCQMIIRFLFFFSWALSKQELETRLIRSLELNNTHVFLSTVSFLDLRISCNNSNVGSITDQFQLKPGSQSSEILACQHFLRWGTRSTANLSGSAVTANPSVSKLGFAGKFPPFAELLQDGAPYTSLMVRSDGIKLTEWDGDM